MSTSRVAHRAALAALIASSSVAGISGCASSGMSLASLNPFKKSADSVASTDTPSTEAGVSGKLASLKDSASGQVSSMGTATKSAFNKTKATFAGFVGKKSTVDENGNPISPDDPTRLDTPASVGPEVFVAQGQLWETTGDFTKAMESYTKALESEPKNASALASIARLHYRQEHYKPASDFFKRALEQTPNDAALLNDYGLTQAKLGDVPGATESFTKALSIAPGTSRFANNLANVKYEAGDAQGALAVLMQHNKPAVAHFNMAYLHYKAGKLADAKTHLIEVVKYEPQAASDSAVSKAVNRSKEMLATIDGTASKVANVAPQAINAANQFVNAFQAPQPTTPPAPGPTATSPYAGQPVASPVTNSVPAIQASATGVKPNTGTAGWNPTAALPAGTASWVPPASPAQQIAPVPTTPSVAPTTTPAPTTTVTPTAVPSQSTPYTLPPGFFNQ